MTYMSNVDIQFAITAVSLYHLIGSPICLEAPIWLEALMQHDVYPY